MRLNGREGAVNLGLRDLIRAADGWLGEKLVDGLADLRKEKCAIEITPKGL